MSKIARIAILGITTVLVLLIVPVASAKKAEDPPPAPIPTQILAGKRVFISYGDGNANTVSPDLPYDELYEYMHRWGKYELTPAPADADLVFEIRFEVSAGRALVVQGLGGSSDNLQLHLLILDPKTRIVLWSFHEGVEGASFEGTARKNFDKAMAYLVDDVKTLTAPHDAPAPNK